MDAINNPPGAHTPRTEARFRVLNASQPKDRGEWLRLWQSTPEREVFAHPGYLELFKTDIDQVLCATYESPAGCTLYPFLLKDLQGQPYCASTDGPATDITTPFGYGGPVAWNLVDRERVQREFWTSLNSWCAKAYVVTEFARLSLFTDQLIDQPSERSFRQDNIVRSLELSTEELWADFRHKVRKNVNQARRSGLRVEVDLTGEGLEDFTRIYSATMKRRNASDDFQFDVDFFSQVHELLPGQFAYFHAFQGKEVISTELVLLSANRIYSWLGGTEANSFELRPNDLLKFEIMLWAKSLQIKSFVLGGGASPQDGIFRYKQSFAPSGVVPFFTRRRIVDPHRYELFLERTSCVHAGSATNQNGFFPAYRAA